MIETTIRHRETDAEIRVRNLVYLNGFHGWEDSNGNLYPESEWAVDGDILYDTGVLVGDTDGQVLALPAPTAFKESLVPRILVHGEIYRIVTIFGVVAIAMWIISDVPTASKGEFRGVTPIGTQDVWRSTWWLREEVVFAEVYDA